MLVSSMDNADLQIIHAGMILDLHTSLYISDSPLMIAYLVIIPPAFIFLVWFFCCHSQVVSLFRALRSSYLRTPLIFNFAPPQFSLASPLPPPAPPPFFASFSAASSDLSFIPPSLPSPQQQQQPHEERVFAELCPLVDLATPSGLVQVPE